MLSSLSAILVSSVLSGENLSKPVFSEAFSSAQAGAPAQAQCEEHAAA